MINETIVTETGCTTTYKRISWSAILIGALIGIGLSFLLNLFGLAIGLSAFTLTDTGASVLAIGGLLGLMIGVIASMITAGYAAGYLGRLCCPRRNMGIIYGFSTWVVALILGAIIAAPLTSYVTNYSKNVSPVVSVEPQSSKNKTTVQTNSTPTAQNPNQKTIQVNATPGTMAWSVFSLFILFFIGALSSCLGGCWGMNCSRDD